LYDSLETVCLETVCLETVCLETVCLETVCLETDSNPIVLIILDLIK
jgi:hypothetical protein